MISDFLLKLLHKFLRYSYRRKSNKKRSFVALRTIALFERDYREAARSNE